MHINVVHSKKIRNIWLGVVGTFYILLATGLIAAAIYVEKGSSDISYLLPTALALLCMILAGKNFVRISKEA